MYEIIDWLSGLDPVFAFMLAMPFVVAIAGLVAEYWRHLRWHSDAEKSDDSPIVRRITTPGRRRDLHHVSG